MAVLPFNYRKTLLQKLFYGWWLNYIVELFFTHLPLYRQNIHTIKSHCYYNVIPNMRNSDIARVHFSITAERSDIWTGYCEAFTIRASEINSHEEYSRAAITCSHVLFTTAPCALPYIFIEITTFTCTWTPLSMYTHTHIHTHAHRSSAYPWGLKLSF